MIFSHLELTVKACAHNTEAEFQAQIIEDKRRNQFNN